MKSTMVGSHFFFILLTIIQTRRQRSQNTSTSGIALMSERCYLSPLSSIVESLLTSKAV